MKKLLYILIFLLPVITQAQVDIGAFYGTNVARAYGSDTLVGFKAFNTNGAGLAGFLAIAGTDSAAYGVNTSGQAAIQSGLSKNAIRLYNPVGIPSAPVASAMLDITSTERGFLAPRMTSAQKTAIASPATGLLIYQTDATPGFYYYTGAVWSAVAGAGGAAISGLTPATASNTIDNINYAQEWQWSTLAAGDGLKLSSTSTAAASNTQTLLNISLSGTHATNNQQSYALQVSNTHTGSGSTGSINVGQKLLASGANNGNFGLWVATGSVCIGTTLSASDYSTGQNNLYLDGAINAHYISSSYRFTTSVSVGDIVLTANNYNLRLNGGYQYVKFYVAGTEKAGLSSTGLYVGNGLINATPTAGSIIATGGSSANGAQMTIQGGAGGGTDKNAGGLLLTSGISTGTGTGSVFISTPTPGASGTGTNGLNSRLTIDHLSIAAALPIKLSGYTVATLPAGSIGMTAYVTDATVPTYLGALTGGGAVATPVFYNGSAWVSY